MPHPSKADILDRFERHTLDEGQQKRAEAVRQGFRVLAQIVLENLEPEREQAIVLTKLEEGLMFATKAIALESAS